MNRFILYLILISLFGLLQGCSKDNTGQNGHVNTGDLWLVNTSEVLYLGSERDRIQSIDSPLFVPIHSIDLNNDELVYSLNYNGTTKVYPVSVLGVHEIVNDHIDDHFYSVTYCPLTGSGIAWNRDINGEITEFGVSGMLYRDNLIPYDRNSLSNWSQMKGLCINGEYIGYPVEQVTLVSTTFEMIKNACPDALVLDHESCGEGICKDLKSGNNDGEPGEIIDLPPEKKYFGIAEEENLLLFDLNLFKDSIRIYQAVFKGRRILVIGHSNNQYFAAFICNEGIAGDTFGAVQNKLPVVMKDENGNFYDLFGNIVEGPDAGIKLMSPNAYFAYNIAWQELFRSITVYGE